MSAAERAELLPHGVQRSGASRKRGGPSMRPPRRHLAIDERGYANLARQVRSPNRDARPAGTPVNLAVVHGISLPPGEFGGDGIVRLFTNRLDPRRIRTTRRSRTLRVSAHFLDPARRRAACNSSAATTAPGTRACRHGRDASAATTFRSASSSKAPTTMPYTRRAVHACSRGWSGRCVRATRSQTSSATATSRPGRKTDPGSRVRLVAPASAARAARALSRDRPRRTAVSPGSRSARS